MAESNAEWGELASYDNELAEVWDGFERLPEAGSNPLLDKFCETKQIDIPALVRVGAKLSNYDVIAFAFPGGIKYRDMVTGSRWSYTGSVWQHLKIIKVGAERSDKVVVCEGETDAARLTMLYDIDVAVLPAGAKNFPPQYADDIESYSQVLVGLDNDQAGEDGSALILERVPTAQRFAPPETFNDWCEVDDAPPLPAIPEPPAPMPDIVFGAGLQNLEVPDITSWFENAVLPIGGSLLLHGWSKSFKSWMALDMLSALAQGSDWACFEPTEEPCKVAVIQAEIPWPYLKERTDMMRAAASEPELWDENFGVWRPQMRVELAAGNTKHEDAILTGLLHYGIQVVLFDPVRRFIGAGDMNSEQDVRRLLGFFERIQREGITVVFVHHNSKERRKGGADLADATGSGAFGGDPDTIVSVALPDGRTLNDPERDLHFTIRNAPAVSPRSMELRDDGQIVYGSGTTVGDEEAQEHETHQPSI